MFKPARLLRIQKNRMVQLFANVLNIKYHKYYLPAIDVVGSEAYEITDNMIFFRPFNDGKRNEVRSFYKGGKFIINNESSFSQISNLDDIILEMVRLYNKALDRNIVLNPYYFMLELTDNIDENYQGKAKLVITELAICNQNIPSRDVDRMKKHYVNKFLDLFIGWNFGLSINRNEELRKALEELNDRVIDMGIREWAGTMESVKCDENDSVISYQLPAAKEEEGYYPLKLEI
ncbi:MAG: hypothetical protein J5892_03085 [Bacilli bacterium]|nr:hypothetical protein [Bacilli bacterium]